jgi:hypothetical protein
MSRTTVVRYQTHVEQADANQRLIEEVFAQLAAEDPGGLRYTAFRLADGVTFVHVATVEGGVNPLAESTAFAAFQRDIGHRVVAPPVAGEAAVVGSYGFPEA